MVSGGFKDYVARIGRGNIARDFIGYGAAEPGKYVVTLTRREQMRIIIILMSMAVIAAAAIISVPYWPNGLVKDYAMIYLNDKKLQRVIRHADTTSFTHLIWNNHELVRAGVHENSGIEWVDEPRLPAELEEAFRQLDSASLILIKQKGFWALPGAEDVTFLNDSSENSEVSSTKSRRTNYAYRWGGGLIHQPCTDDITVSIESGICDKPMFGDWVLETSWYVIDLSDDREW